MRISDWSSDVCSSDLYLLKGGETVWEDGPLTRAVKEGAICYLDEVVEARADTIVVLHPLLDHRRELIVDRLGETLSAAPGFMLVVSYNPDIGRAHVLTPVTNANLVCSLLLAKNNISNS